MSEIEKIVETPEEVVEIQEVVKKPKGRPRIHPIKIVDPDAPKRPRGRPRIHPIKVYDEDNPKRVIHKPALSKSEYNKRYIAKHPGIYEKYCKKQKFCEVCNTNILARWYKHHLENSIHLANLFRKGLHMKGVPPFEPPSELDFSG